MTVEIVHGSHHFVGARQNHVAVPQPGCRGRAFLFHGHHEHAGRNGELMRARERARDRHVLSGDADVAAADAAVANEARCDEARRVARNREAQSLRRKDGRRVDADHLAARRHERSARVARIQRGVGLDDVVHQASRLPAQRSAERADHAGGNGMMKPVRVADGDRNLPDPDGTRVAERRERQRRSVDADNGEIGVRILADEIRLRRAAVGHDDRQRGGRLHDMAVGEDQAVGCKQHA